MIDQYVTVNVVLDNPVKKESYRKNLRGRLGAVGYDFEPCSEAEMDEWIRKASELLATT